MTEYYCGIPEGHAQLKDGDKITLAGVRMLPDGSFTTKCKPGNETVFTGKSVKTQTGMNREQRRKKPK